MRYTIDKSRGNRKGSQKRYIDMDNVNRRIAEGATRKQLVEEFKVSLTTLQRRGVVLPPYPESFYRRRLRSKIIVASLLAEAGASLGEIMYAVGPSKSTLRRYKIESRHSFGQPKADRKRLVLVSWLVSKNRFNRSGKKALSQRKASEIAGANRGTFRNYRDAGLLPKF